jgi:hypothetical protein
MYTYTLHRMDGSCTRESKAFLLSTITKSVIRESEDRFRFRFTRAKLPDAFFPFQTAKVACSWNPSRPGKFLPAVGSLDRTHDHARNAFEKGKKEKNIN